MARLLINEYRVSCSTKDRSFSEDSLLCWPITGQSCKNASCAKPILLVYSSFTCPFGCRTDPRDLNDDTFLILHLLLGTWVGKIEKAFVFAMWILKQNSVP